ncbi:MAG: hypothetical protein AAF458_13565 [Pseudomonadota bacterium]
MPAPQTPEVDFSTGIARLGGDVALFKRLVSELMERERDLHAILADVATGTYSAARERIHALRGVAANLGLEPIGQRLRDATEALAAGDADQASEALHDVRRRLRSLAPRLAALGSSPDGGSSGAPASASNATLNRLHAQIQRHELAAERTLSALIMSGELSSYGQELAVVARHLEQLDFASAGRATAELLELTVRRDEST